MQWVVRVYLSKDINDFFLFDDCLVYLYIPFALAIIMPTALILVYQYVTINTYVR